VEDRYADIADMSYMGLRVPADGTLAVVEPGCKYWAPAPEDGDGWHDSPEERWFAMNYEPVLSMDGKLVDIVAWHEDNPLQWWILTGRGIVLGAPELMRVTFTDLPMYLVSTPAGYRHLSRSPQQLETVVILDWATVDTNELFQAVWGTIFVPSEALKRRLEERNKECKGMPLVVAVDAHPV
jgi:hypothetical protein